MFKKSKVQLTLHTLINRGHITEVTGAAEHGRYRVGAAIHLLRTTKKHLVPEGKEIVTVWKTDSNGASYGEYQLRDAKVPA